MGFSFGSMKTSKRTHTGIMTWVINALVTRVIKVNFLALLQLPMCSSVIRVTQEWSLWDGMVGQACNCCGQQAEIT